MKDRETKMLILAVLVGYFAIGTTVSAEQLCHLVSFIHDGRMVWALKSDNILECTQIAIGGHSSLELLPEKLILFESPGILLTAGVNVQAILNNNRMYTFFNYKSGRHHSLSIENGPFECTQENVSPVTAVDSTTNLSVEGELYKLSLPLIKEYEFFI
ncbi:hypothetical protein HOLleu_24236 [Holothuria leucospilota]|uniref:Uncharacterized protein n=1 Tax=Holothuria leucospilota TaxID=206669 RepID=A0A9Q1H3E7_HOLLE|nr:hypothetical protein HOLleu_24236 [Holothuria leucospilota]